MSSPQREGKRSVFAKLCENSSLASVAYVLGRMVPPSNRLRKYKNVLLAAYSTNRRPRVVKNNPIIIRIPPASVCNYKCLFCEIHKDDLLFPDRPANLITLEDIKNYESFLSTAYNLWFYGGSAEPLMNPHLGDIVKYLKLKYGPRISVNTNAAPLTRRLSDIMVDFGLDYLLVSYHAATKEGYKYLMTGDVERVDRNLEYLNRRKARRGKQKPIVDLNFALQKINAAESKAILNKARELKIHAVHVYKYYGGRNKLQDLEVSFDYDAKAGNRVLDELYAYARENGVRLHPKKPDYWSKQAAEVAWDPENYDHNRKCLLPWTRLQFDPVLDEENAHYVSVCNRINLFKIRYRKCVLASQEHFDKLWNHPVLQYLRATVNGAGANPVCRYCKNYDRPILRNVDADRYAEVRDQAVIEFFDEFRKQYRYDEITGLEVLKENPYPDKFFLDRMNALPR